VSKASSFESIFQNAEVVAMLVGFPMQGHMLRFYKARKINKENYITSILAKFLENAKINK
jgi:hypothetical protein